MAGPLDLAMLDPAATAPFLTKDEAAIRLAADAKAIDALQDRLYAEGTRALLVVLQGIDTSGKDGTIRGVFNATGPLGVTVTAFGEPTKPELARDFLWRIHAAVPRRGTIGIFNRSHYEDVLVARVRSLAPALEIERRYDHINAFERLLSDSGTTILKFMLHISREEQRQRLEERRSDPEKRWKFHPGDLDDRRSWDDYMAAYQVMLDRTSTEWAPWTVVPSDRKWARNAIIAGVVRTALERMSPKYPDRDWSGPEFAVP
ncbi:MAG: polyphosphate kinase 2 family protein [Bauldia sp.]|nr:polyphosphate kinase 2 family protein [Bauldia sp.]